MPCAQSTTRYHGPIMPEQGQAGTMAILGQKPPPYGVSWDNGKRTRRRPVTGTGRTQGGPQSTREPAPERRSPRVRAILYSWDTQAK